MGRPTGFLEIERQDRGYDKPETRRRSWKEFVKPLPDAENRKQAARCMDCGIPFCHEGCPVNNLIPDWNNLVYRDQWRAALKMLHSTNNFPEFTGRVCPAPCEAACTLTSMTIRSRSKRLNAQSSTGGGRKGGSSPSYRCGEAAGGSGSLARAPLGLPVHSSWHAPGIP